MGTATDVDPAYRLIVLSPPPLRGAVLTGGDGDLVGRQSTVDLRLEDPHVSRVHARLRREGGHIVVDDLGSSGGTTVNGSPVRASCVLHDGDTVAFAGVATRFEQAPTSAAGVTAPPAGPAVRPEPAPAPASYEIGQQSADILNNVGGNQYNHYVQERRTAFLEELATLKSNARRLLVAGFLLYVVGAGVYAVILLRFAAAVSDTVSSGSPGEPGPALFGSKVAGVPVGLLGFAAAGIGTILIVIGAVLHVVAAAKRRRFEQELPRAWVGAAPGSNPVIGAAGSSVPPPPPPGPPPPPPPRART